MIAYIRGRLEIVNEHAVIIEANGVGYEIICANPLVFDDQLGKEIRIYTYHYVREDTQVLYGFKKTEDKVLFSKLLNVSGIGPKGALAILASAGVHDFVIAIEGEDEKFLTSFPGVGKKTARQMILDLKGKLPFEYDMKEKDENNSRVTSSPETTKALEEAFEAMRSLGYSDRELKAIAPTLKQEQHANTDEFIRKGLALMMQK